MTQHVLLNNVDHKDLRIITDHGAQYGDDIQATLSYPGEFRNLQAHYPIVFAKSPQTGQFQALALLGLDVGENLFLSDRGWDVPYVPLTVARQPFLIGSQSTPGSASAAESVVHVDLASPRVSRESGEAVFLPQGGMSDYLQNITSMLREIDEGMQTVNPFMATLLELDLLEGFTLNIELDNDTQCQVSGYYTINEDKLSTLSEQELYSLQQRGYLLPLYMAIASLSNFRDLIERKNARCAHG